MSIRAFRRSAFSALRLAALLFLLGAYPAAAASFDRNKFAAIAVDAASGEVLFARNADARRLPASLTKVMTIYLAYEAISRGDLKITDKVVISPYAASRPPSKLGLPAGGSLTVKQALDILVVKSANDVAAALAERLAGTEAAFARRMTARAKALGMSHTRFGNASGLPNARQATTARDLAILGMAFQRDHPDGYRIFDQERTRFRGKVIRGHNRLLARPGIDGFKTGYTRASGFNLLTSGVRDGHRIIAVVLGGPTAAVRDRFMADLIGASFTSLAVRDAGTDLTVATLLGPQAKIGSGPTASSRHARLKVGPSTVSWSVSQGDDEGISATPRPPSKWASQVGAYASTAHAHKRMAEVSRRHPRHFLAGRGYMERIGAAFQVRFSHGSAAEAKASCRLLATADEECLVLQTRR